jgi:hypothetical protein
MTSPTPEDLAQFRAYEEAHQGEPISPETRRAIMADEIKAEEQRLGARLRHNREYNHPPDLILKREVAEEEI